MDSKDSLGDRMKSYERDYERQLMKFVPGIIRLDGRGFHSVCKALALAKPYSIILMDVMNDITKALIDETNAVVGFTQSDEITLVLYTDKPNSQVYFDGKVNKINSILPSIASSMFAARLRTVQFDCRSFSVPTKWEAINCLIWRQQDATRNSIQMVARTYFSHKACEGRSCDDLQEMLWQDYHINWNDYPAGFKRGRFFVRGQTEMLSLPPLTKLVNPVEVIFDRAEAVLKEEVIG
jgi:tRNA(His) 5'-end guanylyltransferase